MKYGLWFFLLVILFVSASPPASKDLAHGEHVMKLNRETYDKLAETEQWAFMKMYAPWCGHCKRLVPQWDAVAEMFHDTPVKVGAWNMDRDRAEASVFGVRGFPTLYLKDFKTGEMHQYQASRDPVKIAEWVTEKTGVQPNKISEKE